MNTIKKEKKSYKGVDYLLKLNGERKIDNINNEAVIDKLWWVLEFCKKDEKWARATFSHFLWYDTKGMVGYRLKDKYHQCELVAMKQIDDLMANYLKLKFSFFWRELKFFFISAKKVLPLIVKNKLKRKNELDEKMGR